jgi:uncharacterized protein
MKSYFPDVNVWVALAYSAHQYHLQAINWFETTEDDTISFCRFTQLGFLRLLTQPSVMRAELRSQVEAWQLYDTIVRDERVRFHQETDSNRLDSALRRLSSSQRASAKQWPDAYLAAFAAAEDLIVVTFDRGLHAMASESVLLPP